MKTILIIGDQPSKWRKEINWYNYVWFWYLHLQWSYEQQQMCRNENFINKSLEHKLNVFVSLWKVSVSSYPKKLPSFFKYRQAYISLNEERHVNKMRSSNTVCIQ